LENLLDKNRQTEFPALANLQIGDKFIIKYDNINCLAGAGTGYCRLLTENLTFPKVE